MIKIYCDSCGKEISDRKGDYLFYKYDKDNNREIHLCEACLHNYMHFDNINDKGIYFLMKTKESLDTMINFVESSIEPSDSDYENIQLKLQEAYQVSENLDKKIEREL